MSKDPVAKRPRAARAPTPSPPPCCAPAVSAGDTQGGSARPARREPGGGEGLSLRMLGLSAAAVVLVGIIGVDAVIIGRSVMARSAAIASAAPLPAPPSSGAVQAMAITRPASAEAAGAEGQIDSTDDTPPPDEGPDDIEPSPPAPGPSPKKPSPGPKRAQTVEQALSSGCSTASVDGLSRQIVAEARCMNASAYAQVPKRKNLVTPGHVFLHLEAPARDQLLRVLDAHPNLTMTVNSAFRTVAQQYLLDRWARANRCGIKVAAHPGESNHESGLALDVNEHGSWRQALESQGFKWLGPSDRMHFDFQGGGAAHHPGLDILAFQRLWNRNHPDDKIAETGRYSDQTESRLKKAPAAGFPSGASCGGGGRPKGAKKP